MICLIGFMGAGKSTAVAELARHGLHTVDSDALIESIAGEPVAEIFAGRGEAAFRELERETILSALDDPEIDAIALGGGAIGSSRVSQAVASGEHIVVWLEVDRDMAWRRVSASDRPLAQDRERFNDLFDTRNPIYAGLADAVLPASATRIWDRALEAVKALDRLPSGTRMFWAESSGGEYPVYVGEGLLGSVLFEDGSPILGDGGRSFGFTDQEVGPLYADRTGTLSGLVSVPPGEGTKSMSQFETSLREMARLGITRSDRLIALGGGVVGDLGGFCAASYQRGIPVVQVPTTLVAQVDSAYGGKTGVDLPEGKNYVGAFHLPSAVVTDVGTLRSLPEAELIAGMAEVVKTALLAGGDLWEATRQLGRGEILGRPEIIYECARYKCGVVSRDEKDRGLRAQLNLGHTVGHAIESVTGYERYRHGEAIALGLLAALRISGAGELRQELRDWLDRHGLPVTLDPELEPDDVIAATRFDKKRTERGVGFVLLENPGEPQLDQLVGEVAVRDAVRELLP